MWGDNTLDIAYSIPLYSQDVVSIKFVVTTYSSGAAHEFHYAKTLNLVLGSPVSEITLDKLFNDNVDYLSFLSDYSFNNLDTRYDDSSWVGDGLKPTTDNFNAFTFDRDGVRLYFKPYQVAAYAYGVVDIVVLYNEMADILDKNGVYRFLSFE